jgi:deoxycytidine triphosphate deaminase
MASKQTEGSVSFLVDKQINEALTANPPLVTDVPADDYRGAKSKVQAASLDLTIGQIFIPGTASDRPGGASSPLSEHALEEGHTAVIKTKESLHLSPLLAGIAFPPATVSLKGLLMTNPGHIDPGYRGPLHLTVINMSSVPYPLKIDERIVRVLFIPLQAQPEAPFNLRHPGHLRDPITSELLERRLSVDFVNVTARAERIAQGAVRTAQLWGIGVPILVAIITVLGAILAATLTTRGDIQKIGDRVTALEAKSPEQALEQRVQKLEASVRASLNGNQSK